MKQTEIRFTKTQADNLCASFQFLIGEPLPSEFDQVYIHNLEVVKINGSYDVVCVSGYTTIPKPNWDDIRPVTNMFLLDYLNKVKIATNPMT